MEILIKKLPVVFDILVIGFGGWFAGMTLANINEYLQLIVLVLTIAGLIWRMFKRKKV